MNTTSGTGDGRVRSAAAVGAEYLLNSARECYDANSRIIITTRGGEARTISGVKRLTEFLDRNLKGRTLRNRETLYCEGGDIPMASVENIKMTDRL